MRAAIYIRVSTEEQAREGYSIEAQKEICMRWVNEKGYSVEDIYIDDGYSSKSLKRPFIQKLIKDVPTRKFEVLVFWRLNRLTRSVKDKIYLFDLFDRYGVSLKSMSEDIDTTSASGRMVTNVLVSVAQGEREQTAENVHATMYERAVKGMRNGAVAPYGYKSVEGQLIIEPREIEIVKRIFEMYKDNYGALAIAKKFNKEGVITRSRIWNYSSIMYIITNPVYCGKLRWNYRKGGGQRTGKEIIVDAKHEPILPEQEFEYIQVLRKRRHREGKKATSDYPFTGVLRCARCHYGMTGRSRKVKNGYKRSYYCLGRFNYGVCDLPVIAEESVNEAFLDMLDISDAEFAKYITDDDDNDTTDDLVKRIQNELSQIQKRKKKWQEAFANDVISLEDLRARTEEDRAREEYIKGQLEAAPTIEKSHWTKEEIIQRLKDIKYLWPQIKNESAKKNFLYDLLNFIEIDSDEKVGIGGPGRRVKIKITNWDLKV